MLSFDRRTDGQRYWQNFYSKTVRCCRSGCGTLIIDVPLRGMVVQWGIVLTFIGQIWCGFAMGGFKEWPLVQWPTRPLPYGLRRTLMKINKKFALQLPKQNFYCFKLCTIDKVRAVRSVWSEVSSVKWFLDRPTLQTAVALNDLGMIMLNRLSLHLWLMSSVPLSLLPFFAVVTSVDVLLQLRDRPSSKSCRQASGKPTGVVAP